MSLTPLEIAAPDAAQLPDPEAFPAPQGENPFGADRHRADHPLYGVFGPDPRRLRFDDAEPLVQYLIDWVLELGTADAPG